MKRFVAFFFVFVAFGVWHKAVAQFSVTLNVDPNPTPEILEWAINPQTVQLTVTNLTSNTERYKIKAQLFKDNELVGETRTEASPLRIIEANSVEVYFAEDVVPEGATKLYGNIDKVVIKTGKIPAGTYRLCTKLVDESGQINLTTDYCQTFFVTSYQQPRLILPIDGNSVPYTGAVSSLNFQWSPVLPQPRFPVYYQIRVVPKMEGQTALYAFRYNTPIINETVPGTTNFIWPVNALEIEPDTDYVWGVISMDEDEKPIGENEGLSEIWGFRFVDNTNNVRTIQGGITNNDCPIEISDFEIVNNQLGFETGQVFFPEFNSTHSNFFTLDISKQSGFSQQVASDLVIFEREVTFVTEASNFPVYFVPIPNVQNRYAIIPQWDEMPLNFTKDELYFTGELCFTIELIQENQNESIHKCEKTICIPIDYIGSQSQLPQNTPIDCNAIACAPNNSALILSLTNQNIVNLCGGLTMEVETITQSSNSQFSGTGEVFIPWLASKFSTVFSDIRVNSNYELVYGDILVDKYAQAPNYPDALGLNILSPKISQIGKWVTDNNPINILDGAISQATNVQTVLKVPLGINKPVGSANTGMTIAITGIKFSPGQNFLQACAAVVFDKANTTHKDTMSFKSENFFFTAAGPIKNSGGAVNLKFPLVNDKTVRYGSSSQPLNLIFKRDSTYLKMTSDCNTPLSWCLRADMDIEIPRAWLLHKNDDGTGNMKAKASLKTDICNLNDILVNINLDTAVIAGTNGVKLSVNQLTWDNSETRNAQNFNFPTTVNATGFKGFTLANANLTLPRDFIHNAATVSINLNNWVIDYKNGISGEVTATNLITFPNLSIVDIGGSISYFELKIEKSSIKSGKIQGQLLLPLCNAGNNPTVGNLNYSAIINSNGLNFSLTPNGGAMMDCPFFANGNLSIRNTSSLRLILNNNKSEFNFTLNGKLDFPDKSIGPIKLSLEADFENIKFDYVKDKVNSNNNTVTFDQGNWNFASPQKLLNYFPFTIDEVRKEVRTNLPHGELYVGGVGFDLVANLNDNIGGEAGLAILGSINYSNGKLTAGFKGIEVDTVVVYANTNSVKLDGELIFQDTIINGDSIKAVKGSLAADFKCMNVGVSAGAVFGKVTGADPYRFFMVQAKALFTPGVPLFAGIALVGGGFGFYKNMEMEVTNNNLGLNGQSASSQVFSGANFTPSKGKWGIKAAAEIATTPSDEAFNGSIAFEFEADSNVNGLTHFGVSGSMFSGAGVLERNKAFITGNVEATYDFVTNIFLLNAAVNINYDGLVSNNDLVFYSDKTNNEYYFNFGRWDDPNTAEFKGFESQMYLMFGNKDITKPTGFFYYKTIVKLNEVGTNLAHSVFSKQSPAPPSSGDQNIILGKGFAAGLAISYSGNYALDLTDRLKIGCRLDAGAEFNISMLDYGPGQLCSCCNDNPIGFNGKYLKGSLGAYLIAEGYLDRKNLLGEWNQTIIASFKIGAALTANFPKPWGVSGRMEGDVELLGGLIELNVSFDFQVGNICDPQYLTQSQYFSKENVKDSIGDIFKVVYIDNGVNDYDPEKALKWTANFEPQTDLFLPERQSNGSIDIRKFKIEWSSKLYKKELVNGVLNYIQIPNSNLSLGKDPIGRYCLATDVEKWECPMFINSEYVGRFPCNKKVSVGDFNGDNFGDIIYDRNDRLVGTFISFYNGSKFMGPYKVEGLMQTSDLILKDFNNDGKTDVIYFRETDKSIVLQIANGIIDTQFYFNAPIVLSTYEEKTSTLLDDFTGDGKIDIVKINTVSTYNQTQARVFDGSNIDNGNDANQEKYLRTVSVLKNINNNTFLDPVIWYTDTVGFPSNRSQYMSKDIDLDGKKDILYRMRGVYFASVLFQDIDKFIYVDNQNYIDHFPGISRDALGFPEEKPDSGARYFDFTNDNVVDKWRVGSKLEDDKVDHGDWYQNYLTPLSNYKLVLNGKIKEGNILHKNEIITKEFKTDNSLSIQTLVDKYKDKDEYFSSRLINSPINFNTASKDNAILPELINKRNINSNTTGPLNKI